MTQFQRRQLRKRIELALWMVLDYVCECVRGPAPLLGCCSMASKAPCARRPSSTSDCSSLHRAPLPNSPTPGPRTCAVSSSCRYRVRPVLSRPCRQTPSRRARRPRLPPARPPPLRRRCRHGRSHAIHSLTPPPRSACSLHAARPQRNALPSHCPRPHAQRPAAFLRPPPPAPSPLRPPLALSHVPLSSHDLLLTARADAQQRLTLQASPVAGAANTPCQVRRRPLPGWTCPAAHPFIAFAGSVAAAAFPAGPTLLRPSRLDPPSLWLDRAFPSGFVAVVAFPVGSDIPLLFCRGRGHDDRRRRVRCRRPPWRGSLRPG